MKPAPRMAMFTLAGVLLLILGALLWGWSRGELLLPVRGFNLPIARASNPLGFYALSAGYLALAGICGYLLYLLMPARTSGTRQPTMTALDPNKPMNLAGRVSITQEGRGGHVLVNLGSSTHAFWWEFGGGDCIAIVDVPTLAQWPAVAALANYPRLDFLHALALQVGSLQCPGARYGISERAIEFYSAAQPD